MGFRATVIEAENWTLVKKRFIVPFSKDDGEHFLSSVLSELSLGAFSLRAYSVNNVALCVLGGRPKSFVGCSIGRAIAIRIYSPKRIVALRSGFSVLISCPTRSRAKFL